MSCATILAGATTMRERAIFAVLILTPFLLSSGATALLRLSRPDAT